MRFAIAVFIVMNFVLTGAGLLLPFAAAENDSAAPWADEVFRFNLACFAGASFLMLATYIFGAFRYLRGHPAFLIVASIVGLGVPAGSSFAYLWYLFNVADATISGPVWLWLVLLTGGLVALAMIETAVLLFVLARSERVRLKAA
ncbi:MAG: hypothetical protein A2148_02940 [Chloroflexi bacterium RBG_16_68_14]|nr:MAG: hypothetical protein A2148_02940 [Chloroflexi bacterium RBG_16_68_14]